VCQLHVQMRCAPLRAGQALGLTGRCPGLHRPWPRTRSAPSGGEVASHRARQATGRDKCGSVVCALARRGGPSMGERSLFARFFASITRKLRRSRLCVCVTRPCTISMR
jgi:hypothetical protein